MLNRLHIKVVKVKTRKQLIKILRKHQKILKERFGISNIGIWGDFAWDEPDECCYVEIVADFEEFDFRNFIKACVYIGEITERKVFIAHEQTTKLKMLPLIEEEKIAI